MPKPKLKALGLFERGKKGIDIRMAKAIKEGLKKKVEEIRNKHKNKVSKEEAIKIIAKQLNVDANRLIRIYRGESNNGDVNYGLFDRLEFPLELTSIHRVLGRPKKLSKINVRDRWLQEYRKHPMLLGAAAILPNSPDKCHNENKKKRMKATLELFVVLRAIGELHLTHR
jgi:hypothetical protein